VLNRIEEAQHIHVGRRVKRTRSPYLRECASWSSIQSTYSTQERVRNPCLVDRSGLSERNIVSGSSVRLAAAESYDRFRPQCNVDNNCTSHPRLLLSSVFSEDLLNESQDSNQIKHCEVAKSLIDLPSCKLQSELVALSNNESEGTCLRYEKAECWPPARAFDSVVYCME